MTDYIKKTSLNTKRPVGNGVAVPQFSDGTEIISTKSADVTNSDSDLNQTSSSENLSAKYKYPRVSEDVPEAGRGQYE